MRKLGIPVLGNNTSAINNVHESYFILTKLCNELMTTQVISNRQMIISKDLDSPFT